MSIIKFFTVVCLFTSAPTFAGTIKQVKNGKALLSLDGEPAAIGNQVYAVNADNKKTAILEITTIKGDQAIAKIVKGSTQPNDRTEPKAGGAVAAAKPAQTRVSSRSFTRFDMPKLSVNFKYMMDTITSKQEDGSGRQEEVSMKGSNFGLTAALDYPIWPWLSLRGYGGYEMLKVKGTAAYNSCNGRSSTDCNVDINYISAGGLVRLNYNLSSLQLWGGLGAGVKMPLTKKSTALKEDNIALANTAVVAFGLDYYMSNKYFIPASFEYHHSFNTSDSVPKISNMAVLIGFGLLL